MSRQPKNSLIASFLVLFVTLGQWFGGVFAQIGRILNQTKQFIYVIGDRPLSTFRNWRREQRQLIRRWWREHDPLNPTDRLFAQIGIGRSQWRPWFKHINLCILSFVLTLLFTGVFGWLMQPASATTNLAIEPITWDFVGLDSNKPETQGPNTYVVGARVCNLGSVDARNVTVRFVKDGVDNGFAFIRLQSGDTYTFDRIKANIPANNQTSPDIYGRTRLTTGSIAGGYIFDTRANGDLHKTKYKINYTPTNCQDFYYNFEVTRTPAAWNTYQRYYIEATASNASRVVTERPRQNYIEKLISQARNEVYSFGCDSTGGINYTGPNVTVQVGDTFTCQARAHTATAYPQMSFTSDIPNVIFQVLDVQSTYSNPPSGVNSTVYADGCGWVNDPSDPRYRLSPSACSSATGFPNVYSDQYPYTAPPTEGKGAVGNDIVTTYKIKVIAFPNGVPNPIAVSNVILDFSGSSYHYNADYGVAPNIVYITVANPTPTDLSVTKTHTGNFGYGDNRYLLKVSDNSNSSSAKAPVILTDTLPAGYSFVDKNTSLSGTQPLSNADGSTTGVINNWNCDTSGQVLTCLYDTDQDGIGDNFPDGASQDLYLNVNVPTSISSGTTSTNFARVSLSKDQTDSDPTNNSASDPTTVLPNADLAIIKTIADADLTIGGNQTSFVVGRQGTYTLAVTNQGNITATTPTVTDTLPPELQFVSATGTDWTCSASGQNITCNYSQNLDPTITTNITLTVLVRDTNNTSTNNTGKVSSETFDSDLSNNSSTVTTPIVRPTPDLSITKTPSPVTLVLNKNSTFNLQVSNVGSDATSGVIQVSEVFPTNFGMQYVSHSGSGWSCIYTDTSVPTTRPCQLGDTTGGTQAINFYNSGPLAAGTNSTIALVVKATNDPGTSPQNNTVTVTTPGDTNAGNNTATAAVSIGKPDLAITKSHADPMLLNVGNDYTIIVTNKVGSATTTGPIIVTESLPSTAFTYVSHTGDGWSCIFESTGTIVTAPRACQTGDGTGLLSGTTRTMKFYNAGPLAAGESSSFTLKVNPGTTAITTPINNTVVVDTEGEPSTSPTYTDNTFNDPTTADNTATGRKLAVEKRLTRVSSSALTVNSTTPTVVGYSNTPTVTQCSPALGLAGATDADDFSGSGNNLAINRDTTPIDSRKYTCPQLTAGNWIQYKMAIASNESNASAKGTQISFNDVIPSIIKNVSWQCTAPEPSAGSGSDTNSCNGTISSSLSGTGNTISLNNISLKRIATGQNAGVTGYVLITVVGQVDSAATPAQLANITNTASTPDDGDLFNNAWVVQHGTGTPPAAPDLTIAKTPASQTISNYAQHTFTLTPSNVSNASSRRITVTDTIPTGLDFVSASGTGWTCSYANQVLTCFTDDVIAAGTAGTPTNGNPITVVVQANSAAALPVTLTNRVSISTPNETALANNNATATVTIDPPVLPNLQISKTDGGATFTQGIDGTYTVTVNNVGTVAATNTITVTDTLPTGLGFVSAVGTNWTCSNTGQIVLCTTEQDIAASGTASPIIITVKPTVGTGTVTNNVRVDTVANGETTTADNTGSDTTPLKNANTKDPNVDLTIAKEARSFNGTAIITSFQQGQQYRYRLTVTNSGTAAAIAPITVTDVLPPGLTYLYSVNGSSGFTCSATGQTVTCERASDLAASGSAVVDLVVQVGGNASGTLTNPARVTSPSDPCADFSCAATNNRTSINTSVTNVIDLAIAKTAIDQNTSLANTQFYQDGSGVYEITVTNNGPSAYAGTVTVDEDLSAITPSDPNFTYISHSDSSVWSCMNVTNSSPCAVGAKNLRFAKTGGLLAGESATITLTINVPDGVTGSYTNTAAINAATLTAANDSVNTNNSATATVAVADNNTTLTLEKDDNDGETPDEPTNADLQGKFVKGGIGRYTIVATNAGLSPAKAPVTIGDTLPSGLTYAGYSQTSNWSCTGTIGSQTFSCIYGIWTDTDNDGDRFDPGGSSFTQQNLPVGASSGVEINVNVLNSATTSTLSGNVYTELTTNSASVSGSNFTTATATEATAIIEPADLAVTKEIGTLNAGDTGTYIIKVKNNGPGTSYPQIYLQDYLPTGLTYTGDTSGPASGDGTWTIVGYNDSANEVTYQRTTALNSGAETTIQLPVSVAANAPASVTNLVRVDGFTPEPDADGNPANGYQDPRLATCDTSFGENQPINNCDALTTPITGGASADIQVIKKHPSTDNSNEVDSVAYNTSFPYTIEVKNNGPNTANNVNLSDVLPASLTYDSVSITSNAIITPNPYTNSVTSLTRTCGYDSLARRVNCNLYTLTSGETVTITLNVKGVVSGVVPNTATVTTTTADTNLNNNSESESVLVGAGGSNTISGKVFNDKDDGGPTDFDSGTETGTQNVKVNLYQDNGGVIGTYDPGDTLIATTTTNANGDYSFTTDLTGSFVITVDATTLPTGAQFTPTNSPTTSQPALLETSDINNNFGYKTPPGNVLFVKRITAINGTPITGFEDDTTSSKATEDNDTKWPSPSSQYLRGAIGNLGTSPNNVTRNVQPGQEVEYTVYVLSNGQSAVRDVKFCDLIPAKTTYVPGSMRIGYNTGTLADPSGTGSVLTDLSDGDVGTFYAGGTTAPDICTTANANGGNDGNSSTNDTGAVFAQIVDSSTNMPYATGAGTPAGSYGFVRFRVKVN